MSANPYGLTPRSLALHRTPGAMDRTHEKKYGDKTTAKYFVYFLNDANGNAVYIGRSIDPEARFRAHRSNQGHPMQSIDTSAWFGDVDHMETIGPFPWDEAVAVEREEIGKHQPPANRDLTARDHRPAVAAASQKIRDTYLAERRAAA